jgi:hypothetical protein
MGFTKDIAGQQFNSWTVLRLVSRRSKQHHDALYLCRCKCGRESTVAANALLHGKSPNCRECSNQKRRLDVTGEKYGRLTALEFVKSDKYKGGSRLFWKFKCDCGNETICNLTRVRGGGTTSCGKCPNQFEHLFGGITIIWLDQRNGNRLPCFIDTSDYALVRDYRWSARKARLTFYAATEAMGGICMHQLFGDYLDHEDHNGLNNRRSNLRVATPSQNNRNRKKIVRPCSSPYKGVHLHKATGKFRARIAVDGKNISLGLFESQDDAARAYDEAARKHHGEFAALNFPRPGERHHSGELNEVGDDLLFNQESAVEKVSG